MIGEAVTAGVPVLASHIPGNIGLLGADYPGYFPAGGTNELTRLLTRAETDSGFLASLRAAAGKAAPLFEPHREQAAWAELLMEVRAEGSAILSAPAVIMPPKGVP